MAFHQPGVVSGSEHAAGAVRAGPGSGDQLLLNGGADATPMPGSCLIREIGEKSAALRGHLAGILRGRLVVDVADIMPAGIEPGMRVGVRFERRTGPLDGDSMVCEVHQRSIEMSYPEPARHHDERRRWLRVPVGWPTEVSGSTFPDHLRTRALDASVGGIAFVYDREVKRGTFVNMRLWLPDESVLAVRATVAHASAAGDGLVDVGLAFQALEQVARERLIDALVTELNRQRREREAA
jgi:hypothetical protein